MRSNTNVLEGIIRRNAYSSQHGVFVVANAELPDFPVIYVSDKFSNKLGYTRADLIGEPITLDFMGNKDVTQMLSQFLVNISRTSAKLLPQLEEGPSFQTEGLLTRKSGVPRLCRIRLSPGLLSTQTDKASLCPCTVINNQKVTFIVINLYEVKIKANNASTRKFRQSVYRKSRKNTIDSTFNSISQMDANSTPNNDYSNHNQKTEISKIDTLEEPSNSQSRRLSSTSLISHRSLIESPKAEGDRLTISHYGSFKTLWVWLILLLTIYSALFVPYNVAFSGTHHVVSHNVVWLLLDSCVDFIFIADVFICFLTTIVAENGETIDDRNIIQMNYVSSWYCLDLLSCLPLDLLNFITTMGQAQSGDGGITSLFTTLKIARLLRVSRVARKLDQFAHYSSVMLLLLVLSFLLSGHWLACIWYAIGVTGSCQDGIVQNTSWIVQLAKDLGEPMTFRNDCVPINIPTSSECYVASLYFVMTSLTSVGFGNISANTKTEQIFCVFVLLFGALVYATIFGNITTIIQQLHTDTNRYHDAINSVSEFSRQFHVPQELRDRIRDHIVSSWTMNKGIDARKVIEFCPEDLRADIAVHLHRKVFNDHKAFRDSSDACLRALATEIKEKRFCPGDIIYHKGEAVDEVVFIMSGCLEILEDDDVVIAILSNGDAFGNQVWKENESSRRSHYYVRVLAPTDLRIFKSDSLKKVLQFYHHFKESFDANMILSFNLCIPRTSRDAEGKMSGSSSASKKAVVGRLSSLPNITNRKSLFSPATKRATVGGSFPIIDVDCINQHHLRNRGTPSPVTVSKQAKLKNLINQMKILTVTAEHLLSNWDESSDSKSTPESYGRKESLVVEGRSRVMSSSSSRKSIMSDNDYLHPTLEEVDGENCTDHKSLNEKRSRTLSIEDVLFVDEPES